MPRRKPNIITIAAFDPLVVNKPYPARVVEVAFRRKNSLQAALQFTGDKQSGRRLTLEFPLPARPEGPTADFLRACGQDVKIGTEISIENLSDRILNIRLSRITDGPNVHDIHFEPIAQEDPADGRSTPEAQ